MPGNMNEEKTQSTHSVVPARKGFWGLIWKVKTRTECGSVANLIQVKSGLLQYQLHCMRFSVNQIYLLIPLTPLVSICTRWNACIQETKQHKRLSNAVSHTHADE